MSARVVAGALVFAVVAACVVLYWPGLHAGYLADDLFQISMLEGRMGPSSPAHLYAFAPGDAASNAAHVQRGSLPWWTHPEFRFVMVRPLSSLLLAFDHWMFPRQAFAHHLHSAVWVVAAIMSSLLLLRRSVGPWVAAIAVASLSIDETMTWMVAWLANRCALVCTVFSLIALWLHIGRAAGAASKRDPWIELALWAAAFAGGEYAIGGIAYLASFTLLGDTRPWRERLRSLWPATIALGGFLVAYVALGGGVYGGTTYVDPLRETGEFLRVMGHRVPRMVGEVWSNWAGESPRFWLRYADSGLSEWLMPVAMEDLDTKAYRHGAFSLLTTLAWVVPAWLFVRSAWSDAERRGFRWLFLGSVLALLPISAIPPATRALLLPNLGASVLVGACVVGAVRTWRSSSYGPRIAGVGLAVFVVYIHFVREFRYTREHMDALVGAQRAYVQFYRNEAFSKLDLHDKHVVVVATPGLVTGIHGVSMMHVLGMDAPKTWHVLAMGPRPYMMRRLGARTIELSSVGGAMHGTPQEILFRNGTDALREGDEVDAGLFVAKVLSDRGGEGPGSVRFRFRWALDDPRIVVLEVGPLGLRSFSLPAQGQTIPVSPPALPRSEPHLD